VKDNSGASSSTAETTSESIEIDESRDTSWMVKERSVL